MSIRERRTKQHLLALAAAATVAGCPNGGKTPPGPPQTPATCASVCTHWASLGCVEAQPTPDGTSCAHVCEDIQSSGIIRWNLDCRGKVTSCDQIDKCER